MRILIFIIAIFFATLAKAQSVAVASGEHEGFSRLVLTFPNPKEWSLLRTDIGYIFSTPAKRSVVDLSQVYRRLSKERLSSISSDVETGTIEIVVDCACHIIPFELRPSIVVLDIKDGLAPDDSIYELGADGIRQQPLVKRDLSSLALEKSVRPEPIPSVADLGATISNAARLPPAPDIPLSKTVLSSIVSVDQTRDELIWQLSKGAAMGVVDFANNLDATSREASAGLGIDNILIGAEASVRLSLMKRQPGQLTGDGARCISSDRLDVLAWESASKTSMGIAENISNLVGEFDRPNLENVEKAVKFYLAMGFGAEARMLLDAFQDVRGDASVWRAMSHIVDLEPVRGPAFDGMQTCDTGAAMWAAMANDELPPLQQVAIPAVLRTFSALPLHLRRHLGPGLASRFLSRGDQTSARAISDAIARAPSEPDASFKLLEATIDLASGDQASAETILKPLSGSSGAVGLQSTVSLIETQITAGEEISQELTTTAEALLHEARGGQSEAALERALSLAYASQNRFSDAFTLLDKAAKESTPIWELLAKQGSDTEVLAHAIFENSQKTPAVTHEMGTKFARRLLDLGFPDQAMLWLSDILEKESTAGPVGLLLAAEIESAREDTAAALSFLDLLDEDESKDLRAKILATMDGEGAVEQLASLGQIEAAAQSAKRQENWSQMGAFIEGGVWQEAAGLVTGKSVAGAEPEVAGQPVADGGAAADTPLLNSRLALKESAAARAVLERLLATETGPSPEN